MSAELKGSPHPEGLPSPTSSEPPVSSLSGSGMPRDHHKLGVVSESVAISSSLCGVDHDGSRITSTTNSPDRPTCSNSSAVAAASFEDDARRAKFASVLHLPMSSGGKSPRSPRNSSLGISISLPATMHLRSADEDNNSLSQSDNNHEGATILPRELGGNTYGDSDTRVRQVLAEAASSPSLGSIDRIDNKSGASPSPRTFNLQPRPNRHSPSPKESPSASTSVGLPSEVAMASASSASTSSTSSSYTRTPSPFGRISPHLHLDLSCVAVPPLNAFSSSSSCGTRCRSDSEATIGSKEDSAASVEAGMRQPSQSEQVGSVRPCIEPPPWAVEAKGEARLEPVCESLGVQSPIDLTTQACFRVGRSPTSDVQLLHATSSRQHALLFHHPNGSCYVVDCGSAHGTFINGERVKSAVVANSGTLGGAGNNGAAGMVIPRRVRRGALIRFGGPGAPCFILKAFTVKFDELCDSADSASEYSCGTLLSGVNQSLASEVTRRLLGGALPKKDDEVETSSNEPSSASPSPPGATRKPTDSDGAGNSSNESSAALLQINTRVNALSGMSSLGPEDRRLAQNAASRLLSNLRFQALSNAPSSSHARFPSTARGKHSLDAAADRPGKRMKLTVDSQAPKSPTPVLVSPVTVRQNIFASPVLSASKPQSLSRLSALTETPIRPILSVPLSVGGISIQAGRGEKEGDSTPPLRRRTSRDPGRKVKFSDQVDSLYAASITPDELSVKGGDSSVEDEISPAARNLPPKTPRALLKEG